MLLNRVEAFLLDGLESEGRAEILHAVHDPIGFAEAAAEREEVERAEKAAQRIQTLLDLGGEIG